MIMALAMVIASRSFYHTLGKFGFGCVETMVLMEQQRSYSHHSLRSYGESTSGFHLWDLSTWGCWGYPRIPSMAHASSTYSNPISCDDILIAVDRSTNVRYMSPWLLFLYEVESQWQAEARFWRTISLKTVSHSCFLRSSHYSFIASYSRSAIPIRWRNWKHRDLGSGTYSCHWCPRGHPATNETGLGYWW